MDFSVIVPTYARPAALAACLDALAVLDYPRDRYEVIVVDDGGPVPLDSVVRQHAGGMQVDLLHQRNQGPGEARNAGAAHARGRWLAFTDDDCRPRAGWLRALVPALSAGTDVLAGGRTFNLLRANVYAEASQRVLDAAYTYFNSDAARARFVASNNMAVGRRAFTTAGGFDPAFRVASEDRELCDRWVWRGGRIVLVAAAEVEHRHPLTLRTFLGQHYAYGRGAARYHRARKRRGSGRLWDDVAFRWRWRELLWKPVLASRYPAQTLALLACWQAANTLGFLREAMAGWSPRSRGGR